MCLLEAADVPQCGVVIGYSEHFSFRKIMKRILIFHFIYFIGNFYYEVTETRFYLSSLFFFILLLHRLNYFSSGLKKKRKFCSFYRVTKTRKIYLCFSPGSSFIFMLLLTGRFLLLVYAISFSLPYKITALFVTIQSNPLFSLPYCILFLFLSPRCLFHPHT